MKKFKKLAAVGLAAAMTFSMAACGSKDDDSTTKADATESQNKTESAATTEDSGNKGGAPYNEGETRTIKIGTWFDIYYDSTHKDIHDDPSVSDEELAQKHFDVVKEVEEKYNVRIEYVNLTWDGIQESISTSILAGNPDCDIYLTDLSFGIPAALNGYAVNLEDVLDSSYDIMGSKQIMAPVDIGKDSGIYLFNPVKGEDLVAGTYMLAFNKQMLDDAGLEDPNVLYEKGEWTWDKWREYMVALTQDKDGDGVTDVYGFGSRYDFLIYLITMSNGTTIASSEKENLSSKEVGECLEFIYNMYNVDHTARPWNPDDFNDETMFNKYEMANRDLIRGYEKSRSGSDNGVNYSVVNASGANDITRYTAMGNYRQVTSGDGTFSFAVPTDLFNVEVSSDTQYSYYYRDSSDQLQYALFVGRLDDAGDALSRADARYREYRNYFSSTYFDSAPTEINDSGSARGLIGGYYDSSRTRGAYVIVRNDGRSTYYMEFDYYTSDPDNEHSAERYMEDYLYRSCSFSGTSYLPRNFDLFRTNDMGSKK